MTSQVDSPRAWLTVVATFFSSAVTLGIVYSFGAFFESMAEDFETSKGETAIVFGLTTFTFFWLSIVTGRVSDRYGPRVVLAIGAVALASGLVITSRVDSLALGYLTYGAGAGIAAACGYVPMVAVVGGWFDKKRSVAVGISVAGIGVGTLVLSPLAARLIDAYGWRTTYVIYGLGGGAVLLLCILLVDRPPGLEGPTPARFAEAARSSVFRRLHLSATLFAVGLFVPFVFIVQYAKDKGVSSVSAALLVGLLGGASVLARVGFAGLSTRLGTFRLYRLSFALQMVSFPIWLLAGSSFVVLVVFVLVLGIGYGGYVALSPIVLTDLLGPVGLGSVLGLFYTASGLGGLVGPPVAGRLIDSTGSYTAPIVMAFGLGVVAFLLLFRMPVTEQGRLEREPQRLSGLQRRDWMGILRPRRGVEQSGSSSGS